MQSYIWNSAGFVQFLISFSISIPMNDVLLCIKIMGLFPETVQKPRTISAQYAEIEPSNLRKARFGHQVDEAAKPARL